MVMEVVSEGAEANERDDVTKREEHLALGIREYWIVDPQALVITVLVRDGDVWVEQVCRGEAQASSTILPGLSIRLHDLWAAGENQDDHVLEHEERA